MENGTTRSIHAWVPLDDQLVPDQCLKEVQQLVDAHGALVRLKKAEVAHEQAAGDLAQIGKVIDALVSAPKPGRPPEVQALNGAAITLLSGHLQGYFVDIHREVATFLFSEHLSDLDALIDVAPTRGNPNTDNINRLFASLGFKKIMDSVSWRGMGNDLLKRKLREFNELRNRIAHGRGETVRKGQVENYMQVWGNLDKHFDRVVAKEVGDVTDESPWED